MIVKSHFLERANKRFKTTCSVIRRERKPFYSYLVSSTVHSALRLYDMKQNDRQYS